MDEKIKRPKYQRCGVCGDYIEIGLEESEDERDKAEEIICDLCAQWHDEEKFKNNNKQE